MRKHCLLAILLACVEQTAFAQPRSTSGGGGPPPTYLREVFTTAVIPKKYAGIEGTPFLTDDWLMAKVKLSDFKTIDSVLVKLNLYERRLHIQNEKGEEVQASIPFDEIDIIDANAKWHNSVFVPGIGRDNEAFFQLVAGGKKMQLVKKLVVLKWETKTVNAEVQRRFELDEKLYLFYNDELYKPNKNCSSIDIFKNDPGVQKFISTNNIKCNKEEDLKKLADYVNSEK